MIEATTLPSLETIPEDIDIQLRYLIHQAPEQVSEEWLGELIKNSGHLTTPEYMRWRVISLIWLATEFDVDEAWPYLMWLNMNEPTMADHLHEVVSDGVEEMQCHVQLANWLAKAKDERLVTFFSTYKNIPAPHRLGPLLRRLLAQADAPETGVWLAQFCRDSADNPSPHMRPWRLLIAAWYATCFDPTDGLTYLHQLSNGQVTLSKEDIQLLSNVAEEIEATSAIIQWIADCDDPLVKAMLKEFGHPDLVAFTENIFQNPPDYDYLIGAVEYAAADAQTFRRIQGLINEAGISPKAVEILDLACGPLAPQTLLLNSAGYRVVGVDLYIPPAYLPMSFMQRFKKGKYVNAWQTATAPYYEALARQVDGVKLTWKKAKVELADLRRLQFIDNHFDIVICANYLHRAPDVNGLLAEAARVLKPGGLFLAAIIPYSSLNGELYDADDGRHPAWGHLRSATATAAAPGLNKWREAQYRAGLENYFSIEQWLTKQASTAEARLTPDIQAELANYSAEELTRQEIVVVARKK